jgi:hypothetical protein
VQHVHEQPRQFSRRFCAQQPGVDEWKRRPVAGGADDHVEGSPAAIEKLHFVAGEAAHVAGGNDRSGVDPGEELGVDDRMRFPEPVIGPWQAVPPGEADLVVDRPQADEPAQPDWQAKREKPLVPQVGGPAADLARHDVIAAARGMHRAGGMPRALDGDVAGGVAAADHEHAPAGDRHRAVGRLVVGGVEERAGEAAGNLRPARLVVVAAGDDEAGVVARRSAGDVHPPAGAGRVGRLDPLHDGAGADVGHEAEAVGITAQVVEALALVGIGGPVPRHRVVDVGGERLRGDQPGRGEDPGRGRAEQPVAADALLAFQAFGVDAGRPQVLQGGEPGRPGADHAPAGGRVGSGRGTHGETVRGESWERDQRSGRKRMVRNSTHIGLPACN